MSEPRANPSAVLAAIQPGGEWDGGKVRVDGESYFLKLAGGEWSLDADEGVLLLNENHFNELKAAALDAAEGETQWILKCPRAGYVQLTVDDESGRAALRDP